MVRYYAKTVVAIVAFCIVLHECDATKVQKCSESKSAIAENSVNVGTCTKGPCKLKRKSTVNVEIKFTPDRDVKSVTKRVHANIIGVPFPFIGVDGNSACENIFSETGEKVPCPLKAKTPYIYRDSFKILEIYPKLRLVVHYSLVEKNQDVTCFEVAARIV